MNENKYREVSYFGFKLNQTSTIILFVLAITSLIGSMSTIYNYVVDFIRVLPEPSIDELISFLFNFVLSIILLAFLFYTVFTCFKMRKNHLNNENKGVNWFGFEMNNTSATVLFLLSLVGVINLFTIISTTTINLTIYLDILHSFMGRYVLIQDILILIQSILLVLIYLYTIQRCLSVLKKPKKQIEISINGNNKKAKLLRFELDETSGPIIFILSVIGVIVYGSQLINYILNSIFTTIYKDFTISDFLEIILILSFLGFYFHLLDSSLNLRKSHSNNKIQETKWLGFEIDKTSAVILFVMSVLGIAGFLRTLFEFIYPFIRYNMNLIEIYHQTPGILIIFIGIIIEEIILLLIYIYTINRCLKVRKIVP